MNKTSLNWIRIVLSLEIGFENLGSIIRELITYAMYLVYLRIIRNYVSIRNCDVVSL
jgi:hypothetical protein